MGKRIMLWAALAAVFCCSVGKAHEIGTTRVSVLFREGRAYDIEIVTDATALLEKLAASVGQGIAPGAPIAAYDEQFRRHVKIAFDGTSARPAIEYSVKPALDAASAPAATLRLSGEIPRDARQFTWSYGWTFASYAMTVRNAGSEALATQWLERGESSAPFVLTSPLPMVTRLATARRYLTLGFTHILPNGLDHILFVLGIYLLSKRARSVLCQVSAFTVAHSIILGLSLYGVVSVSPRIVEPMIAISIAYVAIENLFLSELKSWRVVLVFAFGLLHGMGFAGALKDLSLPRSEFATALVTFNVGVEAGQMAVIAAAFLFVGWYCADRSWYRGRIVVPVSAMIACTAVYWTIQRISL